MKTQTVFPSVLMKIPCPNCKSELSVRAKKPPEEDFSVICPKCNETFLAKINFRKFFRKGVSISIKYTLAGSRSPSSGPEVGKIIDISMEGLSIKNDINQFSPAFHKEGNVYQLFFSLPPGNNPLTLKGKVVNIRKKKNDNTFTIGINFINLDHFSKKEIGFFLM